jgi:hypothetical protein
MRLFANVTLFVPSKSVVASIVSVEVDALHGHVEPGGRGVEHVEAAVHERLVVADGLAGDGDVERERDRRVAQLERARCAVGAGRLERDGAALIGRRLQARRVAGGVAGRVHDGRRRGCAGKGEQGGADCHSIRNHSGVHEPSLGVCRRAHDGTRGRTFLCGNLHRRPLCDEKRTPRLSAMPATPGPSPVLADKRAEVRRAVGVTATTGTQRGAARPSASTRLAALGRDSGASLTQ